jgi:simple sugar transport system permease protein
MALSQPIIIAILLALVCADLLIVSVGQAPAVVYRLLLEGTWGNGYGLGQVLYRMTTLVFTGLSVSLAFRGGLFNIGAEGQLAAGGFVAGWLGSALMPGVPAPLAVMACAMGAAAGGAVVGLVPGALRAWLGVHEVIVTIMLNFIVLAVLNWAVAAHLHVPETLHMRPIASGAMPRLSHWIPSFAGSAANATLPLALLVAAVAAWWLFRSRAGFDLRAVGLASGAANAAGIAVPHVRFKALVAAGALAGLGGINFVLGYKGYYEDGFAGGAGFLGIGVAVAAGSHPLGVIAAALAFATLMQGGLAIHAVVPKQIADMLIAVVMLTLTAASPGARSWLAALRGAPVAVADPEQASGEAATL